MTGMPEYRCKKVCTVNIGGKSRLVEVGEVLDLEKDHESLVYFDPVAEPARKGAKKDTDGAKE